MYIGSHAQIQTGWLAGHTHTHTHHTHASTHTHVRTTHTHTLSLRRARAHPWMVRSAVWLRNSGHSWMVLSFILPARPLPPRRRPPPAILAGGKLPLGICMERLISLCLNRLKHAIDSHHHGLMRANMCPTIRPRVQLSRHACLLAFRPQDRGNGPSSMLGTLL